MTRQTKATQTNTNMSYMGVSTEFRKQSFS